MFLLFFLSVLDKDLSPHRYFGPKSRSYDGDLRLMLRFSLWFFAGRQPVSWRPTFWH